MISNKQCAQLARQMAHEIATRGHTRGTSQDFQGKVCLLGALSYTLVPGWVQKPKPVWHLSGQLMDGIVYSASTVEVMRQELSYRFVQFLDHNYPTGHNMLSIRNFSPQYAASLMAIWNDNILQTGEETIAWLNKFADHLAPVTE